MEEAIEGLNANQLLQPPDITSGREAMSTFGIVVLQERHAFILMCGNCQWHQIDTTKTIKVMVRLSTPCVLFRDEGHGVYLCGYRSPVGHTSLPRCTHIRPTNLQLVPCEGTVHFEGR